MTQSKRHSKTGSSRAKRRAMLVAWLVSSVCAAPCRSVVADAPCEGASIASPGEKSAGAWVSPLAPMRAIGLRYAPPTVQMPPIPSDFGALPTACANSDAALSKGISQPSPRVPEPPRLFASNHGASSALPPLRPAPFAEAAASDVSHAVASQVPTGVILASGNAMPADEAKVSIRIGEPAKSDAERPSPIRTENREHASDAGSSSAKAPERMPQQIKPQAIRTQAKSAAGASKRSAPSMEPSANLNVTRVEGITEHSPVRLSFADDKVTAAPMPRSVTGYAVMRNGSEIPVAVRPIEPGSKVLQSVKSSTAPLVAAVPPVSEHDEAAIATEGQPSSGALSSSQVGLTSESTVAPELESKHSLNAGFVPPSPSRETAAQGSPASTTPVATQQLAAGNTRSAQAIGAVEPNGMVVHRSDSTVPPKWSNPPVLSLPSAPLESVPALAAHENPPVPQSSPEASRTKITLAAGPSTATVRVRAVPEDSIQANVAADQATSLNRDAHPTEPFAMREDHRRAPVLVGAAPPTLDIDKSVAADREPMSSPIVEQESDLPPAFTQEEPVEEALLHELSATPKSQSAVQLRHADMTTESAVALPKGPSLTSGPLENGVVPEGAPRLEVESHTANEFLVEGKITNIHIEDPAVCRVLASNGRVFLVGDRSGETVVAMRTAETVEPIYVRVVVVAAWRNPRLGVTDMEQLRATIANLAPQSNLRIQPQPDGCLWVSGMVDSNEQAKRIMELTRRLVLVPVVDKLEVR
ncbi:MAG: hypothetical protein ACK5OB_15590 [Pirellula sp.]